MYVVLNHAVFHSGIRPGGDGPPGRSVGPSRGNFFGALPETRSYTDSPAVPAVGEEKN
jgi:hypothetical protein